MPDLNAGYDVSWQGASGQRYGWSLLVGALGDVAAVGENGVM